MPNAALSDRSLTMIVPMPADEERREALIVAAGIFMEVAAELGVVVSLHRTPDDAKPVAARTSL